MIRLAELCESSTLTPGLHFFRLRNTTGFGVCGKFLSEKVVNQLTPLCAQGVKY